MNTPIIRTKNIIILLVLGLVVLLLFGAWRIFFFGTATINIQGTHNALTTRVSADTEPVLPRGEEGRKYVLESGIGSREIVISGPLIEQQVLSVDIQSFSDVEQTVETKSLTPIELAGTLLESPDKGSISDSRVYGNKSDWLAIEVTKQNAGDGKYFYVYQYDFDNTEWTLILEGVKIGLENLPGTEAPEELIEYLGASAGD